MKIDQLSMACKNMNDKIKSNCSGVVIQITHEEENEYFKDGESYMYIGETTIIIAKLGPGRIEWKDELL